MNPQVRGSCSGNTFLGDFIEELLKPLSTKGPEKVEDSKKVEFFKSNIMRGTRQKIAAANSSEIFWRRSQISTQTLLVQIRKLPQIESERPSVSYRKI